MEKGVEGAYRGAVKIRGCLADLVLLPGDWPAARPRNWLALVNRPQSPKELEALRRCVSKGKPYGSGEWEIRVARRLGLEHTLRSRGRPRKGKDEEK